MSILTQRRIGALALLALFIITSLTYQRCYRQSKLSPAVSDSVVALKVSRASDSTAHAQQLQQAETAYVRSEARSHMSAVTEAHAAQVRILADSLALAASRAQSAQDSAVLYHAAYTEERRHADSLQVALDTARAAAIDARISARAAWTADSVSQFRLQRVERLNDDLVKDVARITAGCRLLPGIPCPSRTVTMIVTALGTAAVTAAVTYNAVKK